MIKKSLNKDITLKWHLITPEENWNFWVKSYFYGKKVIG